MKKPIKKVEVKAAVKAAPKPAPKALDVIAQLRQIQADKKAAAEEADRLNSSVNETLMKEFLPVVEVFRQLAPLPVGLVGMTYGDLFVAGGTYLMAKSDFSRFEVGVVVDRAYGKPDRIRTIFYRSAKRDDAGPVIYGDTTYEVDKVIETLLQHAAECIRLGEAKG